MRRPLNFQFNFDKFLGALTYIASKVRGLTNLRASKLLFFADKYHLLNHGRPILGDRYACMPYGPVPSEAYDWISDLVQLPPEIRKLSDVHLDRIWEFIEVRRTGRHPVLRAKKAPDLSQLSESDLQALDHAIAKYGSKSMTALLDAGHRERAWKEATSHWIDYRLFFDESDPSQQALLDYLDEQQETEDLLDEKLANK